MPQSELIALGAAIVCYFMAMVVFLYGLVVRKEKPFSVATGGIYVGFVAHIISLALRWYFSGHMPGDNIYELNSVGAAFTVVFFLGLQRSYKNIRPVGIFVLAISLVMIGYGLSKPHLLGPLSDEYQSPWFYVHIISAFLAYSCYVIATSAAILYLLRRHNLKFFAFWEQLPASDFLEDLNSRFVAYGFAGHAIMLASGSIWANTAWGSYWSWDPVETWSLITWLIYAFHLHARTFQGWKGNRLAWITILALVAIVFTFWGIPHLPEASVQH